MKTKEEIFNDYCDNTTRYLNEKEALEAMEEYHRQHSTSPPVLKSACDHIDEKSGMVCISGRCRKCNEIV